jgi:hypothetical protein
VLSSYDGSGYVVDFDPMKTYGTWSTQLTELKDNEFISESTRSIFLTFTIFSPSISMWVACEFLFETSVIGLVNPTYAIIRPFRPDILETGGEQGLWATEFLRLFLIIYILCILIIKRVVQMKSLSKIFSVDVILQLLSDLMIISFAITIFIIVLILSSKTSQDCLSSTTYIDFVQKSYWYSVIFVLESYLLLVIVVKLLGILTVVESLTIIKISYGTAIKQLLSYAFIIFPVLACAALICMQIWGPFSTDYKTFNHAFVSITYLVLGKGDAYLTLAVFVAIFTYSYGLTLMSQGYSDGGIKPKVVSIFNVNSIDQAKAYHQMVAWIPIQ